MYHLNAKSELNHSSKTQIFNAFITTTISVRHK